MQFVVIGGAALQSHGVQRPTEDIDVAPHRSRENLKRLARVLNELHCQLVIDPADPTQDVPMPADYFTAVSLGKQDVWNLRTEHGKLDITFCPSGFPDGFDQLRVSAQRMTVADTAVQVQIAALADVEHSKRTAGRPKDLAYLRDVGRLQTPQTAATPDAQGNP